MDTVQVRNMALMALGAINMIVVVESLREHDWKTGRLLREDVKVVALPYGYNLQVHYKTARNTDVGPFLQAGGWVNERSSAWRRFITGIRSFDMPANLRDYPFLVEENIPWAPQLIESVRIQQ
jgi:hypothetical protein